MSKIKEFFQNLVKAGITPQEPANYDAATLKIYIDHLEAENAALREMAEREKRRAEKENDMAHCGYLDRYGTFFDCSYVEGPYKHLVWCEQNSTDEDHLLEEEGWVKLTKSLPNKYIFCYIDGLSFPQIRWLQNHGYKIENYDLFSKKEKLIW